MERQVYFAISGIEVLARSFVGIWTLVGLAGVIGKEAVLSVVGAIILLWIVEPVFTILHDLKMQFARNPDKKPRRSPTRRWQW